MVRFIFCGGLTLLAILPQMAAAHPACPVAPLAPELIACVQTGRGIAIGRDQAEAERLAKYGRSGELSFARYFGKPVLSYAVVASMKPGITKALEERGIAVVQPWDPFANIESRMTEARAASRRRSIARGVVGEQIEVLAAAAAARIRDEAESDPHGESIVPHELAHWWFIESFWPKSVANGGYGGPGPDWLDEIAAILHETEEDAAKRRKRFGFHVEVAGGPIPFLRNYLAGQHPHADMFDPAPSGGASSGAFIVGPDGKKIPVNWGGKTGDNFYSMGRVFADFVIERSGKERIFATIASAISSGSTFDAWLQAHGAANGLGSSMSRLEAIWDGWMKKNHPAI